MNKLIKSLSISILLFSLSAHAQIDTSLHLICPLNEAILVPPPTNIIHYDPPDLCAVLVSIPDTTVKAVYDGIITNVDYEDETTFSIVMFTKINKKDYYFWYAGLSKAIVRKNQKVKIGQPLGFICQGDKIELNMFQFETPLDPTKYMDCKTVIANK